MEFCWRLLSSKTRTLALPDGEPIWRLVQPVRLNTDRRQTDGQTDGRTDRQTVRQTEMTHQYRRVIVTRDKKSYKTGHYLFCTEQYLRQRAPGPRAPWLHGIHGTADPISEYYKRFTDTLTCQCWHELPFLIHIPFCWTLDGHHLGRHAVHTLLHLLQQLLTTSTCSIEDLKHKLLVVPGT